MLYYQIYHSPIGELILSSDGDNLVGINFCQNPKLLEEFSSKLALVNSDLFSRTIKWLDIYFSGQDPGSAPQTFLKATKFRQDVLKIVSGIPYGKTLTYGEIAQQVAVKYHQVKMSAQAVGTAVGKNPIAIIIPCHRVVGSGKNLLNYSGGIDRKLHLLRLEGIL